MNSYNHIAIALHKTSPVSRYHSKCAIDMCPCFYTIKKDGPVTIMTTH